MMFAIIVKRGFVRAVLRGFLLICYPPFVMVLLGLLGDVHKGNFTWNLKAFDEFQNLPNLPVRFETDFSFQDAEF